MTSLHTRAGTPVVVVVVGGRVDVKMVVPVDMGVVEEYSNSGGTVGDPVTMSTPVGNPVAVDTGVVEVYSDSGGTVGDPVNMSPPVVNPVVVDAEVVENTVLKPMVVPGLNGVVERGIDVVVVAFSVLMQYGQHLSDVSTTLSSDWHSMHCVTVLTIVPMPSDDSAHS
jgi:hypothetical protein